MKITQIRVRNVLGARDISVQTGPVNLFCGLNGQGKSSIQEAVRLALQGETVRVGLKKDYPLMVTDGAKEGFVKLTADGAGYEYRLPAGEHITPDGWTENLQVKCVLDAQRFTAMSADDRRAFLTILTKAKPNKEKIKELMLEAGIDEHRIELAIPMLTSGFPAACEIAKQKATQAKGAWKEVAGGVWGAKKGEEWTAPEVEAPAQADIDLAASTVAQLEQDHEQLQQALGVAIEKVNASSQQSAKIEAAKANAAKLPRLREKLTRDEEDLAGYEVELEKLQNLAGTAPREGMVHDMARFIDRVVPEVSALSKEQAAAIATEQAKLLAAYTREFGPIGAAGDPEALAKIPAIQKSVDLMRTCVANDKRDIAAAEQAEANLAVLGGLEEVAGNLIEDAKRDVAEAKRQLDEARADHAGLLELQKAATERDAKTAKAKTHHLDVVGWLAVAEQFAPDGLPSQILSKALQPINNLLREYATSTEWFQVSIRPDMEILANNRPLTLLSESETWLVNAHIAAAIAELSGIKMLVLDRFDVLDVTHRAPLLYWLDDMAYTDRIDTALVFGTLKEAPKGLPDMIRSFWIEAGELAGEQSIAKAA
jgi:hypothetical protein